MAAFNAFSNNPPADWHRFWGEGDCGRYGGREGALTCLPLRELELAFVSSTRACGDMRLDSPDAGEPAHDGADANAGEPAHAHRHTGARAEFIDHFAPGRPFVCARQVHGDEIVLLTEAREGVYDGRDGFLIPHSLDIAVGVFTADCLAICLYDSKTRDFALLHSGWRGSRADITGKALLMLRERGSVPADIHIACAPSIQACCYQVGQEFAGYFPKESLLERDGHLYFDNQGSVLAVCLEFGVLPEHIYPSSHCTACGGGRFFSHRRDGQSAGRMLTLVYGFSAA